MSYWHDQTIFFSADMSFQYIINHASLALISIAHLLLTSISRRDEYSKN